MLKNNSLKTIALLLSALVAAIFAAIVLVNYLADNKTHTIMNFQSIQDSTCAVTDRPAPDCDRQLVELGNAQRTKRYYVTSDTKITDKDGKESSTILFNIGDEIKIKDKDGDELKSIVLLP